MCTIAAGLAKDCNYSTGGNTTFLFLGNADSIDITTDVNSNVTGLAGDFYRIEVATDTLIDTANMIIGASKNKFWEHKVAFKVAASNTVTRNVFEDLGNARLVAVTLDRNGLYKVYGGGIGLDPTLITFTSGGAAADEYGYTAELMENFPFQPRYILGLTPTATGDVYNFAD